MSALNGASLPSFLSGLAIVAVATALAPLGSLLRWLTRSASAEAFRPARSTR